MAEKVDLPNGMTVIMMGSPEENQAHKDLITKRHEFVMNECKRRGWPQDPGQLSIQQILEIRDMPGWKDPK